MSGTIDEGDLDSYTFTTVAGMEVVVQMTDSGGGGFWPGMRIYQPDGHVSSAQGIDAVQKTFVAASSGVFTVVVYDASGGFSSAGSYSISFTAAPHTP